MARRSPKGIDGPTVRRLRLQLRWTQQRLVQEIRAAAGDLGQYQPAVTVQMISRWENGQGGISDDYARLIEHAFARAFSTTVDTDGHDDAMAEVNRRAFLLGTTAAVSLAVVNRLGNEPWQRLTLCAA